jgi:hypothetical protein
MWLSSLLATRPRSAPSGRRQGAPRKRPGCRPRLETLEDRWLPSQVGLTVNSLADSGPGTLRAAILAADAGNHSDKFTIGFAVTGTIDLQTPLPDLNNSIAIQGPGASSLTVERAAGASFASAIVAVDAGQTTNLSGLTIANGDAGGIFNNTGTLTVVNCKVVNNTVAADFRNGALIEGAGINNNAGTVTVVSSAVENNAVLNGPSGIFTLGGGIFSFNGALTISGSTVSGNSALGAGGAGGGVYGIGAMTISGSTVSGNSAPSGGGIFDNGTLTVSGSTVSDNSAEEGGGICNNAALTVSNSRLSGNAATDAGGGILDTGFALTVSGSTISSNSAAFGGGIMNNVGTATVTGSTLCGNSAQVSGGALFNAFGDLTVSGCTISGNSATYGGGISIGNGGIIGGTFVSVVRDSVFTGNSATEGGAIFNANGLNSSLDFRDSTVSGNTASDSGGGIYNLGTATLRNCRLSGNAAGSAGGGVYNAASATLTADDSVVVHNLALLGADLYNLGALTLNDSTIGVIGP